MNITNGQKLIVTATFCALFLMLTFYALVNSTLDKYLNAIEATQTANSEVYNTVKEANIFVTEAETVVNTTLKDANRVVKKVDGIVDNASESVDKVASTAKEVNTTAKTLQKRGINVNTSELKEAMDEFLPQIEYLAQTLNSLEQKDKQFVVSKQSTKENVQNEIKEENNKKEIELVEQSILESANENPKTE